MTASPSITGEGPSFQLRGSLNFSTVSAFQPVGEQIIENFSQEALQFDLSAVDYADSSALALCLAWLRTAKKVNKTLRFQHLPQSMLGMGQLCGIKSFLTDD